jgi:hypothetical protein
LGLSPSAVDQLSKTNAHWKKKKQEIINGVNKKIIIWIKNICKTYLYGTGYTKKIIITIINNENCTIRERE